MFGIEIIDDDQVEIGGRRHFARAEPAERKDRRILAADAAVHGREASLDGTVERANQDVGEARKYLARLLGGNRARQDSRADQKHMLLSKQADIVEKILVAVGSL